MVRSHLAYFLKLMGKHIPFRLLRGNKTKKPWINKKVRSVLHRKTRLYTRMRSTKSESDLRKYKESKRQAKKVERQSYWENINNIIEIEDPDTSQPSKQKIFWTYIKSLRTGISTLKDNGRLFNEAENKADILNRQYSSVLTREDQTHVPKPTGQSFLP